MDKVIAQSRVSRIKVPGSQHRMCPRCDSADLHKKSSSSTLLGGGDGTEDGDPNHRTGSYTCRGCRLDFERHARYAHVWYTEPATGVLLKGTPGCFERFVFPCQCRGMLSHRTVKLDGVTETNFQGWIDGVKQHRIMWSCTGCSFTTETDNTYDR